MARPDFRRSKGAVHVRAAILDDYQNVALKLADWSKVAKDVEIKVFNKPFAGRTTTIIGDCKDFDIVVDDARAHAASRAR